ncbi:MAG: hypothetical protein CMN30_22190 [Sandaracinus sp.]|nr:hypothetical protein [Sandaracinus sp.]
MALLEPDPPRRLEAVQAALVARAALALCTGVVAPGSALLAARSLETASPLARRRLAAELRRLAAAHPDARFQLAAMNEYEPRVWRSVTWADFPWRDGSEDRSLVAQPFGVLGPEPEPSDLAVLHAVHRTDDPPDDPIAVAVDYRLAALLLEGEDRRETVAGHRLETFELDGRRCVRDSEWDDSEPVCFLRAEVVARDIAIARLAQAFAHDVARPHLERDQPDARVATLPPGALGAPTRIESRRIAAGGPDATEFHRDELHVRATWSEGDAARRCYLVLESHGAVTVEASTSREGGRRETADPRPRWAIWDRQAEE